MSKYELLLILPGTLDEKEAEQRSNEVLRLVEESGSKAEMTVMGKNRLAYPIRQIRYGYFYSIIFTADTEAVVVLQKKLFLMRDLLRAVVSHFKAAAVINQPISYSADSMPSMNQEREEGVPERIERTQPAPEKVVEVVSEEAPAKAEKPAAAAVARDLEKLNIEEINKKLDDLMSGDVIPGV